MISTLKTVEWNLLLEFQKAGQIAINILCILLFYHSAVYAQLDSSGYENYKRLYKILEKEKPNIPDTFSCKSQYCYIDVGKQTQIVLELDLAEKRVIAEIIYYNALREGFSKTWDREGRLEHITMFKSDLPIFSVYYDKNGFPTWITDYEITNESKFFKDSVIIVAGYNPFAHQEFISNNIGVYKNVKWTTYSYHANGTISVERFTENHLDGTCWYYYESGKLMTKITYSKGEWVSSEHFPDE